MAVKRVEVAIVTFGPVRVLADFQTADMFQPRDRSQRRHADGGGDQKALDIVQPAKEIYKPNGISYYRPWIFLITDGAPTDAWTTAARRCTGEGAKAFVFFAVGVENADLDILRRISVREPLKLRGLGFRELFSWLSNSLASVSSSQPG